MRSQPVVPDIPANLIMDFDYFAVEPEKDDIHLGWKRLHEGPEIFYTPRNEGHWVFTRAEDIAEGWRDTEHFSNKGVAMSREERDMRFFPGEADLPEHANYRGLLQPFFSPKAVQQLEEKMRGLTRQLIDGFIEQGGCEFQTQFAQRMPIYTFLTMMQLPLEHAELLLPAADWLTRDPDPQSFMRAVHAMMAYLQDCIAEREGQTGDDFISYLLGARIDDRPLTQIEVLSMTANVMFGGLDTVVSSMGFFMNFLARNPEHRRQLVAEPALIPDAVEELLRRHGIANFGRMATKDFKYKGVSMREGDLVLLPAALYNLDERRYVDPLTVDFRRQNKQHMSFGTGIHRCLGAQLARVELRVLLREWLQRIPDFEISGDSQVVAKSGRINAIKHLPLRWEATT
ncbi:cytochrome P450 [Paraburkholderia sp. GAS32]|uniref:cytochrome P450 n=1 Tax=Paraburkholderia sp. GAS32 TaxID=3035129 RepID=UPI003D22436D